jgi:hypothetical protein
VAITNDTVVDLNDGEWIGTFADFCASNKFEDDEIAEIETALNAGGVFEGGGGALAEFSLKVVTP